MDKIQMEKVNQSREYLVVKSNDLVLQTRYNYTVYEQRTLAYICSMIKPLTTANNGANNGLVSVELITMEICIPELKRFLKN